MRKIILLLFGVFLTLNCASAGVYYPNLYVVGNGCDAGWDYGKALQMSQSDYGIFTWTGVLYASTPGDQKRFKFLTKDNDWHPSITCGNEYSGHVTITSGTVYSLRVRVHGDDGPDNAFIVPENGEYTIVVDLNELKMTCTKKGDVVLPTPELYHLYLVGSALTPDGSWIYDNPPELTFVDTGIFTWTGDLYNHPSGNEFKFKNVSDSWDKTICAAVDKIPLYVGEYDLVFRPLESSPNDFKFVVPAAGEYTIEVNLNTMKLICTPGANVALPIPDLTKLYINGSALSPDGVWEHDNPTAMTLLESGVFSWTGNLYNHPSGNQFKFRNENNSWSKTICATAEDTPISKGEFGLVFRPLESSPNDYKFIVTHPGEYTITANLNTMTMQVESDWVNIIEPCNNLQNEIKISDKKVIILNGNNEILSARIFDVTGKCLNAISTVQNSVLADNLANGIYIVKMNAGSRDIVQKIIIK